MPGRRAGLRPPRLPERRREHGPRRNGTVDPPDGLALGVFFWAYALFQIPTGLLVDRWGPRRALFLFGLLGAVTVAMSAGTMWVDAATGFSFCSYRPHPDGNRPGRSVPGVDAGDVGLDSAPPAGIRGGQLASVHVTSAGHRGVHHRPALGVVYWPWVFRSTLPGLAWSAWFFAWFRDRPDEHRGTNDAERTCSGPTGREGRRDRATAGSRSSPTSPVIFLCSQQFFRAAAERLLVHVVSYISARGPRPDPRTAGQLTSLPIIGVVVGSIIGGLVADRVFVRTGSRRVSRGGDGRDRAWSASSVSA